MLAAVTKWQRIRTFLHGAAPARLGHRPLRARPAPPQARTTCSPSSSPAAAPASRRAWCSRTATSRPTPTPSIRTHRASRPNDRLLGVLPFFHSFGYTVCLWAPLTCGAIAVYYPDPRPAKEVGDMCRTHRVTIMLSTATFLRFYIRRCDAGRLPHASASSICGAEKLPVKLQDEFLAKFGVLPLEGLRLHGTLAGRVARTCRTRRSTGVTQICNRPRHRRPADPRRVREGVRPGDARRRCPSARKACCARRGRT